MTFEKPPLTPPSQKVTALRLQALLRQKRGADPQGLGPIPPPSVTAQTWELCPLLPRAAQHMLRPHLVWMRAKSSLPSSPGSSAGRWSTLGT